MNIMRRCLFFLFALLSLVANAQRVTISPTSGRVVTLKSYGSELQANGFGGMWIHNQLPLTLVVADYSDLDKETGLLEDQANNVSETFAPDKGITLLSGTSDGIMELSLPDGYHFTGYKMTVKSDITVDEAKGIVNLEESYWNSAGTMIMQETQAGYVVYSSGSYYTSECTELESVDIGNMGDNKSATLMRTSLTKDDMGSKLYFRYGRDGAFYAMSITSLEVSFEPDDDIAINMSPTETGATGADCVELPFNTGRVDMGEVYLQEGNNGETIYGYNINNLSMMYANMLLYDEYGINSTTKQPDVNTTDETNGRKIYSYNAAYALKSGTYYIESPTFAKTQGDINIPVGYRITAAKINYNGALKKSGEEFEAVESPSYILKLYGTNKAEAVQEITINSDNVSGSISVDGLNNDAVMFVVEGTTDEALAQLTFDVTIEPLDPYIHKLDAKCTTKLKDGETESEQTLSQQFVATDFNIGGEAKMDFNIYTNGAVAGDMTFSFDNIYNSRHNETYFPGVEGMSGDGISCYNAVGSVYYKDYVKEDPHNESYNSDVAYGDKVLTAIVGDKQFMFNNNVKLSAEASTSPDNNYYEEYLFKSSNVGALGSTYRVADEEGNVVEDGGTLGNLTVGVNELENGESQEHEFYLFIADEPRYVISPATGMRHQYYAYYKGELTVKTKTYEPQTEYVKIYDKTLTTQGTMDGNAYYGVKVTTTGDTQGYLTANQIANKISDDLKDGNITVKPSDMAHLLYIDASKLSHVVHGKSSADNGSLSELRGKLAKNAFIFLPYSTTSYDNNTARQLQSGIFTSCNNVVITDKLPFYTPYDISLEAENSVTYERTYTPQSLQAGSVYSTLLLPFQLALTESKYTTSDNIELSFYKPATSNFVSNKVADNSGAVVSGNANFSTYTGSTTEPNVPYLLGMSRNEGVTTESTVYKMVQTGATIKATPTPASAMSATDCGAQTENVETATDYTMYGSYSGAQLPKAGNYYYFSGNKFYLTSNLQKHDYALVLPFRAYITSPAGSSAKSLASYFDLAIDADDIVTAISQAAVMGIEDGLTVNTSNGNISIQATDDASVSIVNIAGQSVATGQLRSGDTMQVNVAAGMYLVNGRKVIVK